MAENKDDLASQAMDELGDMAKHGMQSPSTKPVLIGAAVGAVAGGILPVITWPVGLAVGAGFTLYKRLRP